MSDAPETGRKAEIVEAATEVFAEKGYDAGSMREIATRVGVSEPALYRHFAGKDALFIAIMRTVGGRMRDETLAMLDSVDPTDVRSDMLKVLRNRREHLGRFAPLLRMILPAIARNPAFLDEYRRLIVFPARTRITEKVGEVDAALEVPDADATREARVRALMSLIIGYMVSSFVLGDDPDEVVVDAALRVMEWDQTT